MDKVVIVAVETSDYRENTPIYEVAVMAAYNQGIIDRKYFSEVENEEFSSFGFGFGYRIISDNDKFKEEFKGFLEEYPYPVVIHNGKFCRQILIAHGWMDEKTLVYDAMESIMDNYRNLQSYSVEALVRQWHLKKSYSNTVRGEVENLYEILKHLDIKKWKTAGNDNEYICDEYRDGRYEVIVKPGIPRKNAVGSIEGKSIVFTGTGPYSRGTLMNMARMAGARILTNTIRKDTDILVVGNTPGSKLARARKEGIEIMAMEQFMALTERKNRK